MPFSYWLLLKIVTAAEDSYGIYILGAYLPSEGRAGAGEFLMSEIMMVVVLMMTKLMMMTMMIVILTVAMEDTG